MTINGNNQSGREDDFGTAHFNAGNAAMARNTGNEAMAGKPRSLDERRRRA
jgi:hypothetical protein